MRTRASLGRVLGIFVPIVVGGFGAACSAAGYAIAFVTGTMGTHARGELLENTVRACIGLAPI